MGIKGAANQVEAVKGEGKIIFNNPTDKSAKIDAVQCIEKKSVASPAKPQVSKKNSANKKSPNRSPQKSKVSRKSQPVRVQDFSDSELK